MSALIAALICPGSSGQAVTICSNSGQTSELCTRFCTLSELVFLLSPLLFGLCEFKFDSPWGYLINSQDRIFLCVLAVFLFLVVYENLLFFNAV